MNNFILYLKSKYFRYNLAGALFFVFTLLFIVFFSLRYYTKHGQGLHVPKLKGLPLAKAISILDDMGLSYKLDSAYIANKPLGTVCEQDPDYNTFVKSNRTIYLTVNTSTSPNVALPEVVNKPFREVNAMISGLGLKLGDTTYKDGVNKNFVLNVLFKGKILEQGDMIPKGSTISLILANGHGAEEVEIPALLGLTKDEAIFALKGASLTLGEVSYEGKIKDSTSAVIISQTPAITDSLTKVKLGTAIHIILSQKKN